VYVILHDPVAEKERDTLPTAAQPHYMELLAMLEVAPWSGDPPTNNPAGNMLSMPFGGLGLATYIVMEQRRLVYVVRITWAG
jgi:hypothetical protein